MPYGEVDYAEVMRLAQEQAVVGLVAAGLEHVTDVKVPQVWALQFAYRNQMECISFLFPLGSG